MCVCVYTRSLCTYFCLRIVCSVIAFGFLLSLLLLLFFLFSFVVFFYFAQKRHYWLTQTQAHTFDLYSNRCNVVSWDVADISCHRWKEKEKTHTNKYNSDRYCVRFERIFGMFTWMCACTTVSISLYVCGLSWWWATNLYSMTCIQTNNDSIWIKQASKRASIVQLLLCCLHTYKHMQDKPFCLPSLFSLWPIIRLIV